MYSLVLIEYLENMLLQSDLLHNKGNITEKLLYTLFDDLTLKNRLY